MKGIHRYKKNQPVNWFHRAKLKSNQYCIYCGRFVGKGSGLESNKEHLIGREFVPTGSFGDGSLFNLIFRACKECNDEKANVERHLSTITLFTSPSRKDSKELNEIAQRKADKDFHPIKQGTLIKDAGENLKFSSKLGPSKISFEMTTPPQVDERLTGFLAYRHVQGIFTMITSSDPLRAEGTCLLSREFFHIHGSYAHLDWGNPQLVKIMERANEIPCYANIETANGFFRAILRKETGETGQWFWALEWNKSLRIVGAIAHPDNCPEIFQGLPSLNWKDLNVHYSRITKYREEIPLEPEQDIMFYGKVVNSHK